MSVKFTLLLHQSYIFDIVYILSLMDYYGIVSVFYWFA